MFGKSIKKTFLAVGVGFLNIYKLFIYMNDESWVVIYGADLGQIESA